MAWGRFYGFRSAGGSKKKKTKTFDNWYERLSSVQLRALLEAANLPVSGSKAKQIGRLLQSPLTKPYAAEANGAYMKRSSSLTVEQLKSQCRDQNLSPSGKKYDLVLRLLRGSNSDNNRKTSGKRSRSTESAEDPEPTTTKKRKAATAAATGSKSVSSTSVDREPLTGDALQKRACFRRQKLNKQISDRLQWKSSFKHMNGVIKGGRVEIDCPEPEVFIKMFHVHGGDDKKKIKTTKSGKLTLKFDTDEELEEAGFEGRSYRYGATADIKAPATLSWESSKLTFSFKYTVRC